LSVSSCKECGVYTQPFAFLSPTNINSTDLNLETLEATVHQLPAVYQIPLPVQSWKKFSVGLETALCKELCIFCSHSLKLASGLKSRVMDRINHKNIQAVYFACTQYRPDSKFHVMHVQGYHYVQVYFHNSMIVWLFMFLLNPLKTKHICFM
jgi:hypothetical protein